MVKRLKRLFRPCCFPVPQRAKLLAVVSPLIGCVCRQEVWVLGPHKQRDNVCQLSLVTCPISIGAEREFVISWVSHCNQTRPFLLSTEFPTFFFPFWPGYGFGNVCDLICLPAIQRDARWCSFPLTNELRLRRESRQTKMTSNLVLSHLLRLW